jgi:CDP-glycerol glycerophosphotransferase
VANALPEDTVLLFRKHHRVLDRLPADAASFALDVSEYPDAMDLLLIADMLVTDYSSLVFDFASTGRPIIFFTPTLDEYRDEVRGFALDFEAVAPGPFLRTTEELVGALQDAEGVSAAFRERYDAFVETYCGLNDGRAAERVVDRLFG